MKFVAAGDMLLQQRIQHNYPGFDELSPFIKDADGRFFNLETTLNHEGELQDILTVTSSLGSLNLTKLAVPMFFEVIFNFLIGTVRILGSTCS